MNTTRTLLAIAHAATKHASGYVSSDELATQVEISKNAAQRIASVVRAICARAAQSEQTEFKWPRGCLVEADEASMRACRVPRPSVCSGQTRGDHPFGRYRILHHRCMCVIPRGQRQLAMFSSCPTHLCCWGERRIAKRTRVRRYPLMGSRAWQYYAFNRRRRRVPIRGPEKPRCA